MTTAHAFIATSADGFIAREDGDIEWLLQRDDPNEDHGYNDFIKDIDIIVMGRGSFEKVLDFDPWPYDRPVIVLSRKLHGKRVPDHLDGKVKFSNLEPVELMQELEASGVNKIYVDGGQIIQSFLREGLLTDMVITSVPVLIGSGRRLFGELDKDISLELRHCRSFPSGLIQSTYKIIP